MDERTYTQREVCERLGIPREWHYYVAADAGVTPRRGKDRRTLVVTESELERMRWQVEGEREQLYRIYHKD